MTSTAPLPEGWNKLYAAVLSDALDAVGVTTQAMPSTIRPLDEDLILCGRARTGIYMETAHVDPDVNPYELEIKLIDDLKPDEVAILACGGSGRIAPWGSLLSTAAVGRKAAGCITDGFVRDIKTIREMKLPVFHAGIAPLDSKGRGQIAAIDVPVICAGVRVCTGDLVFGDADGVVVIPRAVEEQVLTLAFDKIKGEKRTLDDLRAGEKLGDVFAKYGIL